MRYGAGALSLDSHLHRQNGTITMGQCQVGDKIYGPDGRLTTITKKSVVFQKPMYLLILGDGRTLKVGEGHINPIMINTNPNNTIRWEDENLTTRELLEKPLTHTKLGNKGHRGTTTKSIVKIRNTAPVDYPKKDLPIDPYVTGLLLGDGSTSRGWASLHAHVDDMPHYLPQIPYELGAAYLDKRNKTVLSQGIKGLTQALRGLGMDVSCHEKIIPAMYLNASIDQRYRLLQGLMDTDGFASRKTGRVGFCSTSKSLAESLAQLVFGLGGTCTTAVEPRGLQSDGAMHEPLYKLELWLENPERIFSLPRKQMLVAKNREKKRWLTKASSVPLLCIETTDPEPSQCIAVDNKSRQYLANQYVRTHN